MENTPDAKIGAVTPYACGDAIVEDANGPTDGADRPKSGFTMEGQNLLHSLKSFAASLGNASNDPQMERKLPESSDQVAGVSLRCIIGLLATNIDEVDISTTEHLWRYLAT